MKASPTRRDLLRYSVATTAAVGVGAGPIAARDSGWKRPVLVGVADVVLPNEAKEREGLESLVDRFEAWIDGFEPVAELDHPYLTSDQLRYGPPDPQPLWQAQLDALDLEARRRHETPFAELDFDPRRHIVERQIATLHEDGRLPRPEHARHVAVAVLSWYAAQPVANDIAYRAKIERHGCRGLDTAPRDPRKAAQKDGVEHQSGEQA